MTQLTYGSLFSGIGGIDLGLDRASMHCKWQVEIDEYASKVLAKHWPDVARYGDIRDCGAHNLESVDLICGGFPCQDISNAGKRAGIEGERSGLWKEFYRVICELQPQYVLVENVSALLHRGIERVLGDLAESGYDAEWQVLSAEALGAPHLRERIFIVAYPHSSSSRIWQRPNGETWSQARGRSEEMAHTTSLGWVTWRTEPENQQRQASPSSTGLQIPYTSRTGLQGSRDARRISQEAQAWTPAIFERRDSTRPQRSTWWATEPQVGRVAHGISSRVDRLRGLGNAVVPQVAEYVGRCILAAIEAEEVAVS